MRVVADTKAQARAGATIVWRLADEPAIKRSWKTVPVTALLQATIKHNNHAAHGVSSDGKV
jgi:hypothetical protein